LSGFSSFSYRSNLFSSRIDSLNGLVTFGSSFFLKGFLSTLDLFSEIGSILNLLDKAFAFLFAFLSSRNFLVSSSDVFALFFL